MMFPIKFKKYFRYLWKL